MNQDELYMQKALALAGKAAKRGETPIGAVIVREGRIIGRGFNRRNTRGCALEHAEITAIRQASRRVHDWRLEDCTLYVTLEPCPMCAGALVQARMQRVVIGAMNPKAGCAGSVLNVLQEPGLNHQCELVSGVLGEEASRLLKLFFRNLREDKKKNRHKY